MCCRFAYRDSIIAVMFHRTFKSFLKKTVCEKRHTKWLPDLLTVSNQTKNGTHLDPAQKDPSIFKRDWKFVPG